ncbi:hypothetical protein N431DRAFT_550158 [Stipitochalara longipes BDJ]|nr:hypothetical protein N431DRAFT_550158 [Stipitochalara longipes BDJ]
MADNSTSFPWADPSVDLSENKGPGLLIVAAVMPSLAFLIVCIRLNVRLFVVHSFGRDDCLILMASLCSLLGAGLVMTSIHYGFGRHIEALDRDSTMDVMKWNWASGVPGIFGFYFSKVSVAFFLLRLVPHRKTAWFIWSIIGLLTVAQIWGALTMTGGCVPLESLWNFDVHGKCWPYMVVTTGPYINTSVGILVDWIFVILPIYLLWNTYMDTRAKIAVNCILGLGVFTATISLVKILKLRDLLSFDPTFAGVDLTRWSIIELNVGIIAASLPSLRPLFKCLNRTAIDVYTRSRERRRYYADGEMNFVPDSNNALKTPGYSDSTLKTPGYIEIHIDSREYNPYGMYSPYDRNSMRRDSVDHELELLEAGYNVTPIKSPRSPFEMAFMEDALLEPAPLHIAAQHSRKISGSSVVRTSPTSEAIILTDEMDMEYLEEQRRFQIAKARRHGGSGGSNVSLDRRELDILRHEHENMI